MKRETGFYSQIGEISHFNPYPLPPLNPPLEITESLLKLFGEAQGSLEKLNTIADRLPDKERFIRAYVIKEALLSSSIEGIHTTLIDVFTQVLDEKQTSKETELVLNYTKALDAALNLITQENLPLTTRVLRTAHETLLTQTSSKADPGNYRKQSVRVGNLIPPDAQKIPELMSQLEHFINAENSHQPLIKAGLAHVQFETIHPFLDGNGRIGRLLIVLMLVESKLLSAPIIYPSFAFKKNALEYYQKLDGVRRTGDFEGWIFFYLTAIKESCEDAFRRITEIEALENQLKQLITVDPLFYKMRDTAHKTLEFIFQKPVISITELSKNLGKSYNASKNILTRFEESGLIFKTEQKRNVRYQFRPYLNLLEKEYN